MSQTIVPAAPGPSAAPGSSGAQPGRPARPSPARSHANWVVAATRASFQGTPGRLRLIALAVILGCLIAGFGSAWALNDRHSCLAGAKSTTQHLLMLQRFQTNLWQADALISNTFLQGGLENTEQLTEFYASVDAGARDLASAARASDADASVLGQANVSLTRFAGYIESARANNRAGNQVSINYLTDGTTMLRDDVIAKVGQRAAADQKSIDGSLDGAQRASYWMLLFVLAGGALLVWAQLALARITHRYINLPAVGATVVLLVVVIIGAVAMAAVQHSASTVRNGAYTTTVQLAAARVAAFDAKAIESQGLINRGSGAATDPDWRKQFTVARNTSVTSRAGIASLDAYDRAHTAIRTADDGGDWDAAVKLATASGGSSANASFLAYVDDSGRTLASSTTTTLTGVDQNSWVLVVLALLLVIAAVAAAIVAWFGVSQRMGEYR